MKITTWNVNSLRTRLTHVLNFIEAEKPDLLCLQETKVMDNQFPSEPFQNLGLHIAKYGQKSYNGVAFISTTPLKNVTHSFQHPNPDPDILNQSRLISGTCQGIRIINAYVPQGEDTASPKFAFKEKFYQGLTQELALYQPDTPLILCADFNIARSDIDVDDPNKRSGKCMFTDIEHTWLDHLEQWGLTDAFRHVAPQQKEFSWWDYRQLAFQLNRGMRIDWHYTSAPLLSRIQTVTHHRDERKKEQPSDHVPVTLTLT